MAMSCVIGFSSDSFWLMCPETQPHPPDTLYHSTIIHSGRLAADSRVDRHTVELTVRLSSGVRTKASTLTPVGQAAINTNTARAVSLSPSQAANRYTATGNTASFTRVSPSTPRDKCRLYRAR